MVAEKSRVFLSSGTFSKMALMLFIISLACIFAIHFLTAKGGKQA